MATVAHQAAEAEAQIRIEPLPDIVSDRLALEQIFSNLIDNALKYLKPGVPGDITVRGRTKLGFAIFEIADNGRGIDPKDHQRIFDLFRRAGTQDKPGTGHRPRPCACPGAPARRHHVGLRPNFTTAAHSRSHCPSAGQPVTGTEIHEQTRHHHHDRGR